MNMSYCSAAGIYVLSESDAFGDLHFSLLECLFFATLASDVDPVATLAILGSKEVNADPTLYSIVFGESVINDAVCIVLFDVLANMGENSLDSKGIHVIEWLNAAHCLIW
jgi:NhaP-type Na+/H+ or K+/H+ antiporter